MKLSVLLCRILPLGPAIRVEAVIVLRSTGISRLLLLLLGRPGVCWLRRWWGSARGEWIMAVSGKVRRWRLAGSLSSLLLLLLKLRMRLIELTKSAVLRLRLVVRRSARNSLRRRGSSGVALRCRLRTSALC